MQVLEQEQKQIQKPKTKITTLPPYFQEYPWAQVNTRDQIEDFRKLLYNAKAEGIHQTFGTLSKIHNDGSADFCAVGAVLHLLYQWRGGNNGTIGSKLQHYLEDKYGYNLVHYVVRLNDDYRLSFTQIADHLAQVSTIGDNYSLMSGITQATLASAKTALSSVPYPSSGT